MSIVFKTKPNSEEEILKILHPAVKSWFFSRFKEFSLPQRFGIMEVHCRNNVLISAPTGATKTLTAFLSIINELVDLSTKDLLEDKIYCVYVSPLRALNYDIEHNLKEPLKEINKFLNKEHGIRVMTRTGDTSQSEKARMLKRPPHILITTPESLSILLVSKKFRNYFRDVQWVIIDEIHALAENKRGVHLSLSLEFLDRMTNYSLTRIGLSATVAPIKEIAKYLVGFNNNEVRDCKIIDVQFIKQLDLKVLSPVRDFIYTDYETQHRNLYNLLDNLIQTHRTTLIFTNTRASTERVVDTLKTMFPDKYNDETIAAHHSSLSKEHRFDVEKRLREGKLKCVVSSTSLELGIDIGYIDLVILLSSPKSVARALQRCGRSGHQLHDITKGRLVVLDRDDLVECAILLKDALEKKIDKIHIPKNALDVLSQMVYGFLQNESINENELYNIIKNSYCYHTLKKEDYISVIKYLAGEELSLEERNVYAKIFRFEDGTLKARGKLARVIFMTNVGTIPDEARIKVKIGNKLIGYIDEAFLERLRKGDVFVLGGKTYEFRYARGDVAQVRVSIDRPPTVPIWISEMLPLSFDLAIDISRFRYLMNRMFEENKKREEVLKFIKDYLYIDEKGAQAIYNYFYEQFHFSKIPHHKRITVELFNEENRSYAVFHTLFGRRVNDVLSRATAYYLSIKNKTDFELGVTDNGFFVSSESKFNIGKPLEVLALQDIRKLMEKVIENTQILKRRFRHCAVRSLMILRQYKSFTKSVSKQQLSSDRLLNYIKMHYPDFPILKEAKREVLEDLMDIENASKILNMIKNNKIKIEYVHLPFPSPFSMNIVLQAKLDIYRMEDRLKFLKELHKLILAKISTKVKDFSYEEFWKELEEREELEKQQRLEELKIEFIEFCNKNDITKELKTKGLNLFENIEIDERSKRKLFKMIRENKQKMSYDLYSFLIKKITST